ncbi:hypothetical protein POTOM_048378 [Populus tomentosa]|uniref:Poly [ADP-ribose] polymerase n=1 Tax=Populus tomentosa TaxID=118781 RepID=A0A8X7YGG7_POPTO|nr:hypothetical protein POTOM_048378 [Populus tomentosa]
MAGKGFGSSETNFQRIQDWDFVKVAGRTVPDSSQAQVLEDGVLVPLGKPVELPYSQGMWPRNEYIIFDVDQIRIRYVVHAKFCYQTC